MNNSNDPKGKSDSIVNKLIVPILIALIAGGTSPWWTNFLRGKGEVDKPTTPVSRDGDNSSQGSEGLHNEDSLNIQGAGNTVNDNSINAQSSGDQAVVSGANNNVVQGIGNNVVQGTGNQFTIQQESGARFRGEFEIPAISELSYHEAREILVKEGWIPFTQRHFYPQEEHSLQHGNGKAFWDLGYWEVISCSGAAEGFCRLEFSDASGRRLVVITAGMEDPSIPAQAMVNRVFFSEENSP